MEMEMVEMLTSSKNIEKKWMETLAKSAIEAFFFHSNYQNSHNGKIKWERIPIIPFYL